MRVWKLKVRKWEGIEKSKVAHSSRGRVENRDGFVPNLAWMGSGEML